MYFNLVLYRNELKNKSIYKYKLIGICYELISSEEIFNSIEDIKTFIFDIFKIKEDDFSKVSKDAILSKVCFTISNAPDCNIKDYVKKLIPFINIEIEKFNKLKEKDMLKGWIK